MQNLFLNVFDNVLSGQVLVADAINSNKQREPIKQLAIEIIEIFLTVCEDV